MATYAFKCAACGNTQEITRSIEQRNDIVMCVCGEQMSRKLSNIGIGFKGSGFYKTDSRR